MFGFLKTRRRRRLRSQPFPPEWRAIIARNVPIFRRLPPSDKNELLSHVEVFLAEKNFEGCGGLKLTDEIRVTIAAQACVLLLHRDTDYYPQLVSILVYPSSFIAKETRYVAQNILEEGDQHLLGRTARRVGSLVLAWDDTKRGAADPADGKNLVFHEFAHQLDYEDYVVDGAPALQTRAEYLAWARIMSKEFQDLRTAEETGTPTVLDKYGTTNPPEFFAVITEAFFERPRALRTKHPELYAELVHFFHQDPMLFSAESTDEA